MLKTKIFAAILILAISAPFIKIAGAETLLDKKQVEKYSPNRFSFDIKINEFPSCYKANESIVNFYLNLDEDNLKVLSVGCLDGAGLNNFIKTQNPSAKNSEKTLIVPFSFELANRVSFSTLGSTKPYHDFVYWDFEFSQTHIIETMGLFAAPKYAASFAFTNNIGMVFPITAVSPEKYSFLAYKTPASVDFRFILEFGLGIEYFSFFGEYKIANRPAYINLTPTFSFLSSMSFQGAPNLEIESGLRVLPGWRLDIPLRMQYDFYQLANGSKFGISATFDLWFLSGGLGFALRY